MAYDDLIDIRSLRDKSASYDDDEENGVIVVLVVVFKLGIKLSITALGRSGLPAVNVSHV